MVDVAVVGVGKVGAALAAAWQRAGCDVALVAHDLDSSTMISLAATFGFRRMLVGDALSEARAVVFADPREDVATLFAAPGRDEPRAVIIDASTMSRFGVSNVPDLRAHTRGAAVYRAFNTVGWSDFIDPDYGGETPDVFYAGPDDEGRDTLEGLIGQLGLGAVYVGGYDRIELVDSLGQLRLEVLARRPDRDVAVRLLERKV